MGLKNCCQKKKLSPKSLKNLGEEDSKSNINDKPNQPIINNYIYNLNSQNKNTSNNDINDNDNENDNKLISVNIDYKTFIKGKSYSNLLKEYILFEHLGAGAFGLVQKVKHKSSGQIRAMKIIKKDSKYSNKNLKEIENLKLLNHPNILKLYEYYFDKKNIYIITEYCEGGELFDKIKEHNSSFSEKDAAKILKAVLQAVAYCHSMGVVHRDLKPENILLEGNDFEHIKLIDFGTSTIINKNKKFNEKLGTAYYIAPEVLSKNYDEKCDLWSVGVIMYILLTGEPPFNGKNDDEIIHNVKTGSINFNSYILKHVSAEGKDLLKKFLERNTKKRISAAKALEHPWIKKEAPNAILNENIGKKVFNNLKSFSADEKLQEAVIAYIVNQLVSKDEVQELTKIFKDLDENNDGVLNRQEIESGLIKYYGEEKAKEEIDNLFKKIDADGNGTISYEEFIRASIDKRSILTDKNLMNAYKLFDKNGDGSIEAKEIKEVLGKDIIGNADDKIWEEIIKEVDENGDGVISFEEFKKMMEKLCKITK
jgi:calcium-dependent protein kinase